MKIAITFASLSGNTLAVATQLQRFLLTQNHQVELLDLLQTTADDLKEYDLVFFGSSTYGDGDLNPIAEMFFSAASASGHNCNQTMFALFALGDSSYPHFGASGQLMLTKMQEMDADFIGPILTIDGNPDEEISEQTKAWASQIVKQVEG
jgi:flavodoxin